VRGASCAPARPRQFVPMIPCGQCGKRCRRKQLVVQESEKNKALENPGGEAVLKELGGPAGLPYSALLDAQGKLIAAKGAMGLV